jgi:glycosyltransferase involved in cell wall biosynthesis
MDCCAGTVWLHQSASVIIRTKNEQAGLPATLDVVFAQCVPPHQVIVIDSGSRDATLAIARRYPVCALTISPREWGYSRALNQAAMHAHGSVLVCLSAHCVPLDRHWLGNLLRHFVDDRVAGVWRPQLRPGRPVPPPGPPSWQHPGDYTYPTRTWGLSNTNAAVRRLLWEEIPFDESMPAAEDKAWGRAVLERGYCIVHDPAAAAWHAYHSPIPAFRRQRAVNEGLARLFPDERRDLGGQFDVAGRAVVRTMRPHAAVRDPQLFWADVRRAPASVAAIVGGMVARKASR